MLRNSIEKSQLKDKNFYQTIENGFMRLSTPGTNKATDNLQSERNYQCISLVLDSSGHGLLPQ